jgi:transmembrane sensor
MPGLNADDLLKKWENGTLTDEERRCLEAWYLKEAELRSSEEVLPIFKRPSSRKPWYWAAAASVIIGIGTYFSIRSVPSVEAPLVADALPGEHRARLFLGDGRPIDLEDAASGKLVQDGNATVMKVNSGELIYQAGDEKAILQHHTIVTPRAGQFQVHLSDGTRVWLNAASSLRYPSTFGEGDRVVEASGEVYFEVAKKTREGKRVPFRVLSGNQTVEVLGTRFNINSYADEDVIKTTLLEGSIQVSIQGGNAVLKPGQQARAQHGAPLKVAPIDANRVLAWKEGYFQFEGVGIKELMRQLGRWYDMEVVYEGPVKDYEFVGEISRATRLSSVLRILEAGGVRFRVEGKTITVIE